MKVPRAVRVFLFSAVLATMLSVQIYCSRSNEPAGQKEVYAGLGDSARYVGIMACRQCHESIYNTFIETGMGKSFDVASHRKSAASFGTHALVYDSILDYYYHPYWDQDSLRVLEFRLSGKDTVHHRVETVNYIVGSGQHTNSHIMNTNGYLHQVPVTFYTQKGTWDLAPGFENGRNSRFRRLIGLECMSCHNAFPEFVLGSENRYTAVRNGIDCERCHGPGSVHVAQKQAGALVDVSKKIDYSIVNPAKLPVDLQFDVCQRCHIQGNAVLNPGRSFYDFRPGMRLSEVMNVFMPLYKGNEDEHIMASHAERLKQSKCYLETSRQINSEQRKEEASLRPFENALTCVTCHNPHVSVTVTGEGVFNKACMKCHENGKSASCTEDISIREKVSDNCVSCHMPKSGATDIPHVRVTDHRIRIILDENKKNEIRQFAGIACINNPDPPREAIGRAFIAYYEKFGMDRSALDSAAKYFADGTDQELKANFHALVQLAFLKEEYNLVLTYASRLTNAVQFLNRQSYMNEDAWCCYRIAEAAGYVRKPELAMQFYRQAVFLAPDQLDFRSKYGASLMENKHPQEAKKEFEFITVEDPEYFQAWSNLGYLYLILDNDTVKARTCYEQALMLNPDYESARMNQAGLFIYRKQIPDAIRLLKEILKKNPRNSNARLLLNRINTSS